MQELMVGVTGTKYCHVVSNDKLCKNQGCLVDAVDLQQG